ncbi:NAD-dependent epimerase/dehydratase family protein, partial [Mesorhizobium japonicum]|uniref:NAD-dependent epimerase/dehydratase family protein n=1 Tax=Mesorhizobium japonicum TaxID=2066070 RepID=UPI003B5BD6FC
SKLDQLLPIFLEKKPTRVLHLAAQAGVRYSLTHPQAYLDANLQGFLNVLEASRQSAIEHLVFASSSSVYGSNTSLPFSEQQNIDHPVSLYAATKKANELMAHTYSHLYHLPTTGLRFFTVFGPWGRPDMALFLFTKAILEGHPIDIFNNGNMTRDFTFIDDVVESVIRVIDKVATPNQQFDRNNPDPMTSDAPYRIFNVGNSCPTVLMDYIAAIEDELQIKAKKNYLPLQPGDVLKTAADTGALERWIGFKPNTSIKYGVSEFVKWYRNYYEV